MVGGYDQKRIHTYKGQGAGGKKVVILSVFIFWMVHW